METKQRRMRREVKLQTTCICSFVIHLRCHITKSTYSIYSNRQLQKKEEKKQQNT